jgi:hypothetical protein
MPRVGFEPPIPVLKRAKAFHALDRAATVIGSEGLCQWLIHYFEIIFNIVHRPKYTRPKYT